MRIQQTETARQILRMKIKNQISVFIIGIITLPVLTMALFPLQAYMTSAQRFLMKGYDEIKLINEAGLSEDEWNLIRRYAETVPPRFQFIIVYRQKAVMSTMPEIAAGSSCAMEDILALVSRTNDSYDYQFQSIPSAPQSGAEGKAEPAGTVISRYIPKWKKSPHRIPKFFIPALLVIAVFEAFSITVIILIAKSISRSIEMLQQSAQKIAGGDLETKIEIPAKRSANEITCLQEDLEAMKNSLKEDQQRRSRFIMGISHDLRTPVALIKGYAEAISDGVASSADIMQKSLSIISAKAEQLESMIDDLINYVKLNNAEWKNAREPVEIRSFLEECAAGMVLAAQVYRRSFFTSITLDSQSVLMDRKLFSRALENLFGNALRYTRDGDSVFLEAWNTAEGKAAVCIRDTGIGIPEGDLEKVFEPFFRATNSRRENGMGIGLSVVRQIVSSHGWDIAVKSEAGKGTAFTITMS